MTHAYIYDAIRTPRGKGRPDGALHEVTSVRLSALVLNAIKRLARAPRSPLRHVLEVRRDDGECVIEEIVPCEVGHTRQGFLELIEELGDGSRWRRIGPVLRPDAEAC